LTDLAELAISQGVDAAQAADIRSGRSLIDLELQQALGQSNTPRLDPAFSIGQDGSVLAALFPVSPGSHHSFAGYNRWLKAQGPRSVQD
jgi:hypothetical protein